MGKNFVLGLMAGLLLIAFGCSGSGSGGGTTAYTVEQFEFPLTSTDVEGGKEVYAVFCEGCHPGAGGKGDGPEIVDEGYSPAKMRWQVRAGADDMPAFGPDKISDADLEALLAYTETFGATQR
jgi:mono/diheme cytochrome c family protein